MSALLERLQAMTAQLEAVLPVESQMVSYCDCGDYCEWCTPPERMVRTGLPNTRLELDHAVLSLVSHPLAAAENYVGAFFIHGSRIQINRLEVHS